MSTTKELLDEIMTRPDPEEAYFLVTVAARLLEDKLGRGTVTRPGPNWNKVRAIEDAANRRVERMIT